MSKGTGNNRISALKRLSKPAAINNRQQLIEGTKSSINDARQLLGNKNQSAFDARQLLSRQSSNIIVRKNVEKIVDNNNGKMVVVTGLKDMKMKDGRLISTAPVGGMQVEKKKNIYAVGPSTFVTFRNNGNNMISSNQATEKISFTKTITNASVRREDDDTVSSLSNKKVVISFVNDQYDKNPKPSQSIITTASSSSSPSIHHHRASPPIIKRLHDASIQTTHSSSSSRPPIRTSSHRRHTSSTMDEYDHLTNQSIDDDDDQQDDPYEPPVKRTASAIRKTATTTTIDREQQASSTAAPTGSVKRTSTGAPVSSRIASSISAVPKQTSTTQSSSTPGTILVTNLQTSVTEEDVIELFSQIGRINEITTLSPGCVQIIFAKREHGELAVTKYHNRLLDGQFMYVSLQQTLPPSTTKTASVVPTQNVKSTSNTQPIAKENGSTINQPLKLNSATNSSNKIVIDPAFIRQALFHPSNNTTNPVQFQVKL